MKKLLPLLLLTLVIYESSLAQHITINEKCKEAYNLTLSLRIHEADLIIKNQKQIDPHNLYVNYIESFGNFLKITVSNDEGKYDDLQSQIINCIDLLYKVPDTTPWKYYLIGNLKLQLATLDFSFGNYIAGAFSMNKAYRLLLENKSKFPNFLPNEISIGVLHIMIGIVPDSYHWILDMISMNGGVTLGTNELNHAYNKCLHNTNLEWLKNEIVFFMGMTGINLNPDTEFASQLLAKIDTNTSNNLLTTYLKINILMKSGKNDEALKTFSQINHNINFYPFHYLNFLKGECYLRKLENVDARTQFTIFVANYKGDNYVKDAWQKIGWTYLLETDTLKFKNNLTNVLNNGNTKIGNDLIAENTALSANIPNTILLKARLLFDGGYYIYALSEIQSADTSSFSTTEKVEMYYRLGRIYHRINNTEKAIANYKSTIDHGYHLPQYYAANAALKTGNIYEQLNDFQQSAKYYNICLNLDFQEYRNSIRAKAKQGLKRVE